MNYADCAEIETTQRKARILFEPQGWGPPATPYQNLHDQTDVSGYEMFVLESTDNFNNPFQKAMEALYMQRGWFGLILRDVIRKGSKGTDDKGKLNLDYVSHAGTEWEKKHNVWAPQNNWYVPNDDCERRNGVVIPFQPGTMVPFETVKSKAQAIKRFKKYGIDPKYVSYFFRLDNYDGDRFAGRGFGPGVGGLGRFLASLGWLPSGSGDGWVASLPAYRKQKVVMKVSALPQEVEAK
ncbi:MAG: hypothetical protein HY514_01610 [Candidatus Aenigmarchaeota archaeon]|nr:hypothetical protein [Candidatus Aenigmarchaeota archaeon]